MTTSHREERSARKRHLPAGHRNGSSPPPDEAAASPPNKRASRPPFTLARQPYNAEPWLRRMHEPGVAWRNLQLGLRNELGQHQWARQSGYSRRSLVETHNARLKHYTGASLRCRHARAQQVEWRLRVRLVNAYWALWAAAGGTRARAIS